MEKSEKRLAELMHARNAAELAFLKAENELVAFLGAQAYLRSRALQRTVVGSPIINRNHLPGRVKEEIAGLEASPETTAVTA